MDEDSSMERSRIPPEDSGHNAATMDSLIGVVAEATSIGSSYTQPGNTIELGNKETLKRSLYRGIESLSVTGGYTAECKWKKGIEDPRSKVTVKFKQEQSVFSRYGDEIQRLKTIKTVDSATFGALFGGWPRQYPRWVQDQLNGYDKGHMERICMVLAANPVANLTRRRAKSELSARRAGEMLVSCILLRA
jgi:hypothetical protein